MKMRQVYQTTTIMDAELVRMILRDRKIRAFIEGDASGIRGPATPITLWVKESDAERARAAIEKRSKSKAPARKRARSRPVARKRKS